MLTTASALKGYAIEAKDGTVGTVCDVLFSDRSWKVRWLVVDTGTWLNGNKVLIHPSAVDRADRKHLELVVALTKAQVEGSVEASKDRPVSHQSDSRVYDYYGRDADWGRSYFVMGVIASPLSSPPLYGGTMVVEEVAVRSHGEGADPHLRSASEIVGFRIHAGDGGIGQVEDFLIDSTGWNIRYLAVDTGNWWPGKHVLVSPLAVREVLWSEHRIRLDLARNKVRGSPPWSPTDVIDGAYERQLHGHYGWPSLGADNADDHQKSM